MSYAITVFKCLKCNNSDFTSETGPTAITTPKSLHCEFKCKLICFKMLLVYEDHNLT